MQTKEVDSVINSCFAGTLAVVARGLRGPFGNGTAIIVIHCYMQISGNLIPLLRIKNL